MAVLVTGGTGYIGSHTCIELLQEGYEVVVVDNLSNSDKKTLHRIEAYTNKTIKFYEGDIRDRCLLDDVFKENNIESVVHFAALKAVGESSERPIDYYSNNVAGTIVLLEAMKKYQCCKLVFSSSATVYGDVDCCPITEDFPLKSATNPYGKTKQINEQILQDLCSSNEKWSVALLRYFNPAGAHPDGIIGESPVGIPNNLMPYITQVAVGKQSSLNVYGNDYDTPDGTGIRDYIHVVDLAKAHVKALGKIEDSSGCNIYNIGTGKGYSVLELVRIFESVTGMAIPYVIRERRPGDIAECYCDPSKAKKVLNWEAKYNLQDMCRDAWNWQLKKDKL